MLRVVTDCAKLRDFFLLIEGQFRSGERRTQKVGIPNASWDLQIFWHPQIRLWAHFDPNWRDPKAWKDSGQVAGGCIFGVTDLSKTSSKKSVPISLEINFPFGSFNRNFGGRIMLDAAGRPRLGHSGRINKIQKDAVLNQYPDKSNLVTLTPKEVGNKPVIDLGHIDAALPQRVAKYANWIASIK